MIAANDIANATFAAGLEDLAGNDELLEVGRKAVEDLLVEFRDNGIGVLGRNNGLIIRHRDGTESGTIRFGPETAIRTALLAIAKHLQES